MFKFAFYIKERMKINIVNKSNNPLPMYETEFSAGVDLRAFIQNEITLKPMERQLIPTDCLFRCPLVMRLRSDQEAVWQ